MPTSSELIQAQRDFEIPRGLNNYNTHWHSLLRMQEELSEAIEAYLHETPQALATEVVDVVIFSHSLLGRLAEQMGWEPSDIDQLIEAKMAANHRKYDEEFFATRKPENAIACARHWWNLGLADEEFRNDVY